MRSPGPWGDRVWETRKVCSLRTGCRASWETTCSKLPPEDLIYSIQPFYCLVPAPQGSQTIQGTEVNLNNLSNKEPWELTYYWPRNHKYSLLSYNLSSTPAFLLWARRLHTFAFMNIFLFWSNFIILSFPGSRANIFIVHQQGGNGTVFASCPCDKVKKRKDSPVSGSGDKKRRREEEKERENLERMPVGIRAAMFSENWESLLGSIQHTVSSPESNNHTWLPSST